jgi:hypothetical protein
VLAHRGAAFPYPPGSQLFFPALTSLHPEDGTLLPLLLTGCREMPPPREVHQGAIIRQDVLRRCIGRFFESPSISWLYICINNSLDGFRQSRCKLAFIRKNRSRWVGAGVTVGEGYRDYDRDRDRTVVKEREPFERYWHSERTIMMERAARPSFTTATKSQGLVH